MDKDTLAEAKADFKICVDAESQQRKEAEDDLRFALLGEQWHEEDVQKRKTDGRPCLTINRLPAFIKQVTNDARQNRPSIAVHPVGDGSDKEVARIFRDLIRNIEKSSKADIAYDTGLDFAAYCGVGYWIVRDQYTCEDSFDKELMIERVANPFCIYGDYESTAATSVDWNRAFKTDLYSKKAFEKRWKGADASGFEVESADEDTKLWFVDKQIRVAEWWTREEVPVTLLKMSDGAVMLESAYLEEGPDGFTLKDILDAQQITVTGDRPTTTYKVTQRVISGVDVLETVEWKGKYIPIVPVYGNEINVNGKRYFQSLVRFAKDPQRMFNYWRTAATELVALAPKAPYVGAVGAFATDASKWATANNTSHPYIEYDPVPGEAPPQRQAFAGVPAGALQEAMNASDDMKAIMGLHDASLGAASNETSGRAIMARQREGDVSTFNFTDNRNRAIEHTGTILVDLIPKHYGVARMVRCIKEDGGTYEVPVNQHVVPVQDPNANPGQPQEQFQPVPEPIPGISRVFDLTVGKYDVTVSAGPSFTSRREETATQMIEFIRAYPPAAGVIGDQLAKNLDWEGADVIAERLKALMPPPAQGGPSPQMQEMGKQMQQMGQQLQQLQQENQQAQLKLQDKSGELALKDREIAIKEFEAQTDRMRLIQEAEQHAREQQTRAIEAANQPDPGEQRPPV